MHDTYFGNCTESCNQKPQPGAFEKFLAESPTTWQHSFETMHLIFMFAPNLIMIVILFDVYNVFYDYVVLCNTVTVEGGWKLKAR